ncbi:MAG: hypothetical protein HY738_15035 [Bacteroidia bacterium]|nr:hypothetical protein [Bacteroidia bacterium]
MNITNMENNGITMPENKEQSFSTENKGSENLHGNEKNNIQNTDISEISEGSANILQNEKDLTANIPAERAQNITDESYIEITKSAENSDDDEPLDPEDFEIVDYTSFSKEQLNTELKKLLAEKPIQDIKISADLIKTNFYKKLKLDTEKKRKAFIDA